MPGAGQGVGVGLNPKYSGLFLPNGLHIWQGDNAFITGSTMTLPDTGSIGGLDLTNPTAAQLPSFDTINGKQSVLSDGVDDVLHNPISDFRGSDTTGVMHFVVERTVDLTYQFLFTHGVLGGNKAVSLYFNNSNKIIISISGTTGFSLITSTNTVALNDKIVITILCDDVNLKLYNGSTLEGSTVGTGGVNWFGDITDTLNGGIDLLARVYAAQSYSKLNSAITTYTPYTSVADAFADQKIIADFYNIAV